MTTQRYLTVPTLGLIICTLALPQSGVAQGFGALQLSLEESFQATGEGLNEALKLKDPTEDEPDPDRPRLLTDDKLRLRPPGEEPPSLVPTGIDPSGGPTGPRAPDIFSCMPDCTLSPPGSGGLPTKPNIEVADDIHIIPNPSLTWPPRGSIGISFGDPIKPQKPDISDQNREDGIPKFKE